MVIFALVLLLAAPGQDRCARDDIAYLDGERVTEASLTTLREPSRMNRSTVNETFPPRYSVPLTKGGSWFHKGNTADERSVSVRGYDQPG